MYRVNLNKHQRMHQIPQRVTILSQHEMTPKSLFFLICSNTMADEEEHRAALELLYHRIPSDRLVPVKVRSHVSGQVLQCLLHPSLYIIEALTSRGPTKRMINGRDCRRRGDRG